MKPNLTSSVADHIIAENQKLKNEVIFLKKNLKIFQTKMMQALDKLTTSLSTKTKDYKKLLLFNNPYDCLTVFVEEVTKSTSFSLNTFDENQKLTLENKRLNRQIKKMQEESIQRIRKEQDIIEQLNQQIEQKKLRLNQLEEDYTNLLKTKKTAQKELNETKEQMKILRLKLYQEQREKLTQIIVASKKQMADFRRSMEMEAYKQEVQFKKQVSEKDKEIKLLTKNIEELINSNLKATSDLTVLEKIVKPIRESTQMKDEISVLRKEVFTMKNELRQKESKILGLEGQNADIALSRDNLKSKNERLQIEKNLLIQELQEKTEELQTAIKDRKALDLYYSEKWHSEFSKVRQNLQAKYNTKIKALQKEFQYKKKQIEAQIQVFLERLRIMKNELTIMHNKNEQLTHINQSLNNKIGDLNFELNQSKSVIRQAQKFHTQDLLTHIFIWEESQKLLKNQLQRYLESSKKFQSLLNKTISKFNLERNNLLHQKHHEIQQLNKTHQNKTQQLQNKHKKQLVDLENHYKNTKEAIEAARAAQLLKFQQKQKEINLKHQEQLKQADKLAQAKVLKIQQKFNSSELKFQKLRKQRQEQLQQNNIKMADMNKVLHQRDKQLIARDVEIQEYKKMKDNYMSEISSLNLRLNEQSFLNRSLKVQLEGTQKKLEQTEELLRLLQSKKHKFREQIKEIQQKYKTQFNELDRIHKKAFFQWKMKITQLQRLFEKRPIKKQHYVQIQELEKKNLELKTQIQLKQAENLIISEVKQYYEQKANSNLLSKGHTNQQYPSHIFLQTNNFLKSTTNNMRQTIKITQQAQKPVYLKKYSNRKNKLIASAIKLEYFEESQKQLQTKEVAQMKRYLSRQHRINETSVVFRTKSHNDRSKSCMN